MERAIALLFFSFITPAVVHAADASDCRNLLTADEVAKAVGGAAKLTSAGKRGEVGTGAVEDERLEVCTWAADTWLAGVNIDLVRSPEPADLAYALKVVASPLEERRTQRWPEERQDFGGVDCSSFSPPRPSKAEARMTGCVGEVDGAALYVSVSSRTARPTFDLVKRLFDEAAARL